MGKRFIAIIPLLGQNRWIQKITRAVAQTLLAKLCYRCGDKGLIGRNSADRSGIGVYLVRAECEDILRLLTLSTVKKRSDGFQTENFQQDCHLVALDSA